MPRDGSALLQLNVACCLQLRRTSTFGHKIAEGLNLAVIYEGRLDRRVLFASEALSSRPSYGCLSKYLTFGDS